ncbi:AAA family ATPase [Pseudovibrio brasiliensis]|uniref:AAA family ATPase n=1 Tax=Pseudovibrio brasiliensis TaxID=1898042 RepID=A0ABX8AN92_9HYPH|nr:AAA family ATPase [Pseudovibrio brasiliensis]QUS56549.1 AAA family ATPase [Pseudovibrio brasiliensis]
MIRAEYLRFMEALRVDVTATPGVRKIANLVLKYLDTITPLSSRQGHRIKRTVQLAQTEWEACPSEIDVFSEAGNLTGPNLKMLQQIKVGPFRGFFREEVLKLDRQSVLIYGPNGTGKSSFCEALEFALLGSVAEADGKRFRNQDEYYKNASTGTFSHPQLLALDAKGDSVQVQPNEEYFRFCFVEKNRIDSFSCIAAQAPSKQTELISTLFGLDQYIEFSRNFSPEMDGRYIDLIGKKGQDLAVKQQSLIGAHQRISQSEATIQAIAAEQASLAQRYLQGLGYQQLVDDLLGGNDKAGKLSLLEEELRAQPPTKSGVFISVLDELTVNLQNAIQEHESKTQQWREAGQQISYKQLYSAVSQLQPASPNHCPACKTPISHVTVDPFQNASGELQKLSHLANLETQIQSLTNSINGMLMQLANTVEITCDRLPQNNPLVNHRLLMQQVPNIEWWRSLQQILYNGWSPFQILRSLVGQLEQNDKELDHTLQTHTQKQQQLALYRSFAEQITVLNTRMQEAVNAKKLAETEVATFNNVNAQLIAAAKAEILIVERNKDIAQSYSDFVKKLNSYNSTLPAKLVSDLGQTTATMYNAINRFDPINEQIGFVYLPTAPNQKLQITFKPDANKRFDALHVLSEGHIRCLGLAILLAKNLTTNSPFLIFDDPVNAIDDEHRRAIRQTLFEDVYFNNKQILLACHGQEFLKDIHQAIGSRASVQTETYKFLPKRGEKHVVIERFSSPPNYVLAARDYFNGAEYRDALMSARRALESLCRRTWYHYEKSRNQNDGLISLPLRGPDAPWELRSLTENLRKKLSKTIANIPNKLAIITALDRLLGVSGNDPHWSYLNKGTHEEADRVEFEQTTVGSIVEALEELDRALAQ